MHDYKILVVDDLQDVRSTLAGVLSDQGYSVVTAGSETEAIDQLRQESFTLIITDIRLLGDEDEDDSGLQLVKQIREHNINSQIILMTGKSVKGTHFQVAKEYNVLSYIEKSAGWIDKVVVTVSDFFLAPSTRKKYLDYLIATHQHLSLQGISMGSLSLSVLLEKVYVSLTAIDQRVGGKRKADGKNNLIDERMQGGGILTIASALQQYRRLVVIGDPGCGKTTLLSYLALTYARQDADVISNRLNLAESDYLPVLLPLRNFGQYLHMEHPDLSKDGPALLLRYLQDYYAAQAMDLPDDFFEKSLEIGKAIILLDGIDEVADKALRERIARLIENFTARYPEPRYVVTSRIVGYEGTGRIGAGFGVAKVRDFSSTEVRQFVHDWTRAVEVTVIGSDSIENLRLADERARELIGEIEGNPRVADLAVNPLLLTVIILVHRYRAKLPTRRSELYEEAMEVLLSRWDDAKSGIQSELDVGYIKLDGGDRRSLLESVAFWMHERHLREIDLDDLRIILLPIFENFYLAANKLNLGQKALELFLRVVNNRSGLLVERGLGVYSFSSLTFQEYLTARALADRDDSLEISIEKMLDPWWREVIKLEASYLSTQGQHRVSELIQAIKDYKIELEPYHNLVLAAECLYDIGLPRVKVGLVDEITRGLLLGLDDKDAPFDVRLLIGNILGCIGDPRFPEDHLEPELISVPAGVFWMGSDRFAANEQPTHKLSLPDFQISRYPITNAQFQMFLQATGEQHPEDWRETSRFCKMASHPVVNVSWFMATAYCEWLSEISGKNYRLPTEAEWEKSARGSVERRTWPWGDTWNLERANIGMQVGSTTPVGIFPSGRSPFGVDDAIGNVWEWCSSLNLEYLYNSNDGRENPEASTDRIIRGGDWTSNSKVARCSSRQSLAPSLHRSNIGFRIACGTSTVHAVFPKKDMMLGQTMKFFSGASFETKHADVILGDLVITTSKRPAHSKYGNILVRVFDGDLTGNYLRKIEERIKSTDVSHNMVYAVYSGELSDDAFWQMGAYKIEGLTIVALKASVVSDILVSKSKSSYYRSLTSLEREYLGRFNRYDEVNAIQDPTWFFGRRQEVDEIIDRLRANQHAGIFGMRKIGKSSLLFHLKQRLSRDLVPIAFLGLQSGPVDSSQLLVDIIQQLRFSIQAFGVEILPESKILQGNRDLPVSQLFKDDIRALWQVAEQEIKAPFMALMIDEVDRIVPYTKDAKEYKQYDSFFAPIRDLSQVEQCLVSVVTAESPAIREEFDPEVGTNTMFELYNERYLSNFSYEECANMVIRIGKWMGIEYSTDSLQMIFKKSGGHPYIARALCFCVTENHKTREVSVSDVENAIAATLKKLKEYFRAWWKKLSPEEVQIILSVLKESTLPVGMSNDQMDICDHLQHQGIIIQTQNEQWSFSIQLLSEWLKRRIGE
jgi:formylglycine-generating enzyme required for sulfatase activity/CheY-like chemotaxis protein